MNRSLTTLSKTVVQAGLQILARFVTRCIPELAYKLARVSTISVLRGALGIALQNLPLLSALAAAFRIRQIISNPAIADESNHPGLSPTNSVKVLLRLFAGQIEMPQQPAAGAGQPAIPPPPAITRLGWVPFHPLRQNMPFISRFLNIENVVDPVLVYQHGLNFARYTADAPFRAHLAFISTNYGVAKCSDKALSEVSTAIGIHCERRVADATEQVTKLQDQLVKSLADPNIDVNATNQQLVIRNHRLGYERAFQAAAYHATPYLVTQILGGIQNIHYHATISLANPRLTARTTLVQTGNTVFGPGYTPQ